MSKGRAGRPEPGPCLALDPRPDPGQHLGVIGIDPVPLCRRQQPGHDQPPVEGHEGQRLEVKPVAPVAPGTGAASRTTIRFSIRMPHSPSR